MKCYLGLGTNLGHRRDNLENAVQHLSAYSTIIRCSPIFESHALTPLGAPDEWKKPFLNGVVEIETSATPNEVLHQVQKIEKAMGRAKAPRWAPRIIDIDLLTYGHEVIKSPELVVPHPELSRRSFVLDPLKHLDPNLKLDAHEQNVLAQSRQMPQPLPLWMGIVNLTPDSFSDGGALQDFSNVCQTLEGWDRQHIQIFDLGAESTRPGATPVTPKEEWHRLQPALEWLRERSKKNFFRPLISVDTHHTSTAVRALELGADMINDVSGLKDPEMLEILQNSSCQYVLMHSLSVPADSQVVLGKEDPVALIKDWARHKLESIEKAGVSLNRVLFDPGIGFGKTAEQSKILLHRIHEFYSLPVRILVGHSRKSFLKNIESDSWSSATDWRERDAKTLGISLALAKKGVDVLRVHTPREHALAHMNYLETIS